MDENPLLSTSKVRSKMLSRESVNIKTMYRNALIINHGWLQSDSTVGQEMITLQMVCGVIHVANIIIHCKIISLKAMKPSQ